MYRLSFEDAAITNFLPVLTQPGIEGTNCSHIKNFTQKDNQGCILCNSFVFEVIISPLALCSYAIVIVDVFGLVCQARYSLKTTNQSIEELKKQNRTLLKHL